VAIGLDIGTSAVRAVQVQRSRRGTLRLTHRGEVALPSGAVVDGDVVDPDVVTDALRVLWKQAQLRPRTVAVGLASQRVTVRQIDLPDLPDADLRDAVRLQAQDQLPISVDQALLDHLVVERYPVGDERRNVRVLLVAAEQEMVERLLAAVTGAKLRPALVDLDAFALVRSLAPSLTESDQVEIVVDVGASITKIAAHRGGNPLFVRMVRLGGDSATRALQEALELSWDEAEAAKLDASRAMAAGTELALEDERARVLNEGVQRIITEVRRSLDFFRAQHHDVAVKRALLSGGASLAAPLADRLEAVLELPVEHGAPLEALDVAGAAGDGEPASTNPFLGVAVGLALGLLR
jgi:type IV pilus assembly protein PilM